MNRRALLVSCLALAVAGCAVPPPGTTQAMKEGLVAVHSPTLDELYLRPDADLSGYRKVMIDPVPVDVRDDFLTQTHAYNRIQAPSVYPYRDALGLVKETAATLESSVAEAFKARGYEIVEGPGPGVLRLSPAIGELYINAPDRLSPYRTRNFTRDAGQAILYLEARDAVTGTLLGRVVHHALARELSRINVADDVSNRFWFDTLFRRWAENSAAELQAGTRRP